ncbi:hypothetical protein AGMMS4952_25830 [Spirochaetia bacterium]|nr:hypothetical protein AGMMS4952_25830 [Spirochaetia bacterium]
MYWTVGADVRWNLQMVIKKLRELKLDLFVLGGYYFASLNMSYGAEWQQTVVGQVRDFKEEVFLDFRSSSYFLGLQISKEVVDIGIFKLVPYVGFRAIIADSDSDYEWETRREATLTVDGQKYLYPRGIRYKSAGVDSDLAFYAQIYGGAEVTLGFIPVTIGIAYDPASSNFSVNVSARFSTARH